MTKRAGGEKKESVYDKKASKDKIGKFPVCDNFYYQKSRRGSTEGQTLASAFLSSFTLFSLLTISLLCYSSI